MSLTIWTSASNALNTAARPEPATTATTNPIAPSLVRCSTTIRAIVATPTIVVGTSTSQKWVMS